MFPRFIIRGSILVLAGMGVVQVRAASGDLNCDGAVNGRDVGAMVLAVIDPSGYAGAYPGCAPSNGDFDCDGDADVGDVPGFVDGLLAGHGVTCPPAGMISVPAGESVMGDFRNEGGTDERPAHLVSLSSYYIDAREVTNQQYADGLNWALAQGGLITVDSGIVRQAGAGTTPQYCDTTTSSGWSRVTWNGSSFGMVAGKESHPVTMVSWYGAAAYCNWRSAMAGRQPCYDLSTWTCDFSKDGYRLPTEAEWEKAAAWDPTLAWHFRYGEHTDGCGVYCLDGHRANFGSSGDPLESDSFPYTVPVGYYDGSNHGGYQTQDAKSYYGCRDMSGNVWEWCQDWYDAAYYQTSPASDPTGPASGTVHALRGGSWFNDPVGCRASFRNHHAPGDRNPNDGFRCACRAP